MLVLKSYYSFIGVVVCAEKLRET